MGVLQKISEGFELVATMITEDRKAIVKLAECIDQLESKYLPANRGKIRTRKKLIEEILEGK